MANISLTETGTEGEKDKFAPASKYMSTVEYDPKALTMEITFKSGSKTKYFLIYPSTFLAFKKSPNHDSFFSKALKGTAMSVKIIANEIGRSPVGPLKAPKKENHLDRGLKHQQLRSKKLAGTINRAFQNAAITST